MRRSARLGDGHLFGHLRDGTLASADRLRVLLADAGRPTASFGLEAIADFGRGRDAWIADVERWAAAGGTHLAMRTMPTVAAPDSGCRTVDDHIAALATWADALHAAGWWGSSDDRGHASSGD
jgi:hypothetical protein